MTESKHQKKLIQQLENEGYYVLKLIKTNKNGIPDLIALKPSDDIKFIEVKGLNGKLSELQKYRIEELKKFGFKTEVSHATNK